MREAPALIQALKATVNALDIVIPMHAVVVDPSAIKGTRHKAKSVLPHGVITRGILACLKNASGAPAGTIEIALIIAKQADVVFSKRNGLLRAVSKRLNALAEKGTVVRHHNPVTVDYGSWSLAPKFFED